MTKNIFLLLVGMFLTHCTSSPTVTDGSASPLKDGYVKASDGSTIHYIEAGKGETTLVFLSGWLGNANWWENQIAEFQKDYHVIAVDRVGTGKSSRNRKEQSLKILAQDVQSLLTTLDLKKVVLIGHSLSGYVIAEVYSLTSDRVGKLVMVDTLLDLEKKPTKKEKEGFFKSVDGDFKATVTTMFPKFTMVPTTPALVKERIIKDALEADSVSETKTIKAVFGYDGRKTLSKVNIPVRGIHADQYPTNEKANRKYIHDYSVQIIKGVGHFPMLEAPEAFNAALRKALGS